MTPRRLAHYQLIDKIGQGGMGEVYRARDTLLDREVAIKILPEVFAGEAERLARFEREAKLLASLNDPGIAAVYGLHEDQGTRFLAMELVAGEDLSQRMARGRLPVDEVLEIAAQIAAALEVAHENGVIHRDLKPSNVMLTPDGKAKVLDFGLAKSLDREPGGSSSQDLTQSPTLAAMGTMGGVILGTAAYMSPEQARGKPLDRRTDIWSFGVMLYEMLGGRQLFMGETLSDTMADVLKGEIDLGSVPAQVPDSVRALLERCLDRDPRSRLRDIGEARLVLANPGDPAPGAVAKRTGPGRRTAFVGLAAGLILGSGITMWSLRAFVTPAAPGAEAEKVVFEIPLVERADVVRGAMSPDERRVVYTDTDQLWVRDLDRLDARAIAGTRGAVAPFWSPDGEWIGYSQGTRLYRIPSEGGDPFVLCDVPGGLHGWAGQAVWSSDGQIRFTPGDGGIFSVSDQGGDPVELIAPGEGQTDFHQLCVAEDGTLFFVAHEGSFFPVIQALRDGVVTDVLRLPEHALGYPQLSRGHLIFYRAPSNRGVWAVPFSLEALETTGEPFLISSNGNHPFASPEGSLLHFLPVPPRSCQVAVVSPNGALVRALGEPGMNLSEVTRSADGKQIAFIQSEDTRSDLWVMDSQTGEKRRLTFGPEPTSNPSWSPDGNRIVARTGGPALGNAKVMTRSVSNGSVDLDLGLATRATFSPDGRWIAYTGYNANFNPSIWYRPADGSGDPILFFDSEVEDLDPAFSPDGRYLSYMSDASGRDEIYVRSFPDGESQWQVSYDGGQFAKWSPDGSRLCFQSHGELFQVTVSRVSGSIAFSAPSRVMDLRGIVSWDTTDNPGEFLVIRLENPDDHVPGIAVTLNWDADLR